jgi:Resolvase, N terminal domain
MTVQIEQVAAYGRCAAGDSETSRGWQFGHVRSFVDKLGGRVVTEYFDVGQPRSVRWERRSQASRLLAALKDPDRGWGAVVVSDAARCWRGSQFSSVASRLAAHGVELWVPELGGRFDGHNPSHMIIMSVLEGPKAGWR